MKNSNVQNPEEVKDDTIKPSKLYSAKALNINAELIKMKLPQNERLIRLNNIARKQMELLKNNKSFDNLEYIENKINNVQELPMWKSDCY